MEAPFSFGRTVSAGSFTNRTADVKRLQTNLQNGINTILISPRRWGKSSLVKKVAGSVKARDVRVVILDLMGIRNEEEFYKVLATETIKATNSKLNEWVETARDIFRHIQPKISIGPDPAQDFDISFEYRELERNYKEVLNLPETIAQKKKIRIIVCIDEFQNCEEYRDPGVFQKRLRSEWQHHKKVTYCLYGSRHHMMSTLFEKQSQPFYKFGDVMYLPKISRADWIHFITHKFSTTKKSISPELAGMLAGLVQDHSYYVQQLAYLVWTSTAKTVTREVLAGALDDLLAQNAILYSRDTEQLTANQFSFLKAVAQGYHTGLSSREVMEKYQLGTSANVLKLKRALIEKELVDEQKGVHFLDPVYELWFKKYILKERIFVDKTG